MTEVEAEIRDQLTHGCDGPLNDGVLVRRALEIVARDPTLAGAVEGVLLDTMWRLGMLTGERSCLIKQRDALLSPIAPYAEADVDDWFTGRW